MRVTYCVAWSDELREPTDPMPEQDARLLDGQGEPYTVVLGDPNAPDAVIEVVWKNSFLGVSFVDEEGRTHTMYSFEKVDENRLFMVEVGSWTYSENAQFEFDADVVETVLFRPDGYVRRTVDANDSDKIEVTEYEDVPMDANWEPMPRFGHWETVARYDRDS